MPRTILITAGTSIIENLKDNGDLAEVVQRMDGKFADLAFDDLLKPPVEKGWAGTHDNDADPGAWWFIHHYGNLSPIRHAKCHAAELASLAKLNPTATDEVVFLCSHTRPGLFCALVLAHLIKDPAQPVRVVTDPTAERMAEQQVNWGDRQPVVDSPDLESMRPGSVSLWVIPGLKPEDTDTFEQTGAGNLVRSVIKLAQAAAIEDRHIVINFTGGYKATIPLLTLVASWLESLTDHQTTITMTALYQESADLLTIPIIKTQPHFGLVNELRRTHQKPMASVPAHLAPYFKDVNDRAEWSLLGLALDIAATDKSNG